MQVSRTPPSAWANLPVAETTAPGPGRSASSVGHLAKAAVAAAREAGAELPANAQGLAASQIARGGDPTAVFAAFIPPVTTEPEVPDVTGPEETVEETPEASDTAESVDSAEAPPPGSPPAEDIPGATSAETALALLSYGEAGVEDDTGTSLDLTL